MLAFQIKGEGTPVVLVHAFPHSSNMWEAELEIFSKKAKVIAPDLPGFGRSALEGNVTIPQMAAEIAKLLDHLKIIEPVFLAGLSMGGYIVFEFFRQFPKRLRALGLFATKATADSPEAREKRSAAIQSIRESGMEPFARNSVKNQLGKTTQEKNPALVERVLAGMKQASPEATMNALRAMAERRDSADLLGTVRMPVLVIGGEEDPLIKPEEMHGMHEKIQGSEFHLVSKAGHLVNLENPQAFGPFLEAFFETRILKPSAARL